MAIKIKLKKENYKSKILKGKKVKGKINSMSF